MSKSCKHNKHSVHYSVSLWEFVRVSKNSSETEITFLRDFLVAPINCNFFLHLSLFIFRALCITGYFVTQCVTHYKPHGALRYKISNVVRYALRYTWQQSNEVKSVMHFYENVTLVTK